MEQDMILYETPLLDELEEIIYVDELKRILKECKR